MNHEPRDLNQADLEAGLVSLWLTPDQRSQYLNEWLHRKQADQDATKDLNIN